LNRVESERLPENLVDLLIRPYDELARLVALADTEVPRLENCQAGKPLRANNGYSFVVVDPPALDGEDDRAT
jgi:hypothetical protein